MSLARVLAGEIIHRPIQSLSARLHAWVGTLSRGVPDPFDPQPTPAPAIEGFQSLEEPQGEGSALWDSLLLAVPKKRTTHGKKRMRMSGKYLRPHTNMVQCQICDQWKRPHMYCTPKCPGRRNHDSNSY